MKSLFPHLLLVFTLAACSESSPPGNPAMPEPDTSRHPVTIRPEPDPSLGTAWFLGADKKVKVCLESAPTFPVPLPRLRELVTKAFGTWRDYAAGKRLSLELPSSRVPAFGLQLLDRCEGTTDLRMVFGTDDVSADEPAVLSRTRYDAARGWGAGWLWVAPQLGSSPWKESTLFPVLLHELGEMAGNDAVAGTILDSRYLGWIERSDKPVDRIDLSRELYVCVDCAARYEGKANAADKSNRDFFKALLDEKMERGEITVTLERDFFQGWKSLGVKAKDGEWKVGAKEKQVLRSRVISATGPNRVFRSYLGGKTVSAHSYTSEVELLASRSEDGDKVLVTVEENASIPLDGDALPAVVPQITLRIAGENGDPVSLTLSRAVK